MPVQEAGSHEGARLRGLGRLAFSESWTCRHDHVDILTQVARSPRHPHTTVVYPLALLPLKASAQSRDHGGVTFLFQNHNWSPIGVQAKAKLFPMPVSIKTLALPPSTAVTRQLCQATPGPRQARVSQQDALVLQLYGRTFGIPSAVCQGLYAVGTGAHCEIEIVPVFLGTVSIREGL